MVAASPILRVQQPVKVQQGAAPKTTAAVNPTATLGTPGALPMSPMGLQVRAAVTPVDPQAEIMMKRVASAIVDSMLSKGILTIKDGEANVTDIKAAGEEIRLGMAVFKTYLPSLEGSGSESEANTDSALNALIRVMMAAISSKAKISRKGFDRASGASAGSIDGQLKAAIKAALGPVSLTKLAAAAA